MKRKLIEDLKDWKTSPLRKPLIIRGARQVGKTWCVREFAKTYDHYIEFNFEENQEAKQLFQDNRNFEQLLERLDAYTTTPILPGKTLIFLDEIQTCEEALIFLRYFKEKAPNLHVIAAGSLLEFLIEKVGMPVGRVQFLFAYPLSFIEYLDVLGHSQLKSAIGEQTNNPALHKLLMDHVRNYMWLGGMPEVVAHWVEHKQAAACQTIQDEIITAYQNDFEKYAKSHEIPHIKAVFDSIPRMMGKKFVYSHVEPETRTYAIKNALSLLERAGIAQYCYHSSAQALPLGGSITLNKMKVFLFDTGLAHRMLGIDMKIWILNPMEMNTIGPIAEQFVAQELLAYQPNNKHHDLYYWHREAKSSNAEVDFVIRHNSTIVPIEVKSGKTGTLKSMQAFLNSHPHSSFGLKIANSGFATHANIKEIPLYGIAAWLHEQG